MKTSGVIKKGKNYLGKKGLTVESVESVKLVY